MGMAQWLHGNGQLHQSTKSLPCMHDMTSSPGLCRVTARGWKESGLLELNHTDSLYVCIQEYESRVLITRGP